MTVEPASARAKRINSDNVDFSYMGPFVATGHESSPPRAGRRGGRPRLVHRHPEPMNAGWLPLREDGRVHLRGPRQCLRVNIFADVRHFAALNSNVEDPIVPERLSRGFDFPSSHADDQNAVSLSHEFGGL